MNHNMHTIDTHSHLNLEPLSLNTKEIIERMNSVGVGTICVGINAETSLVAVQLSKENPNIWACVGHHPIEWQKDFELEKIKSLAMENRAVGVGECGLDYFREKEQSSDAKEIQENIFRQQIELAIELDLPLMLHIRPSIGSMNAYEDTLDILHEYKNRWSTMRGTAHFFAGTLQIAKRFCDLGFHISFSGVITFAKEYEKIVQDIPIERILSETDAPFAAPVPYRGKTNEPAYVVEIVKKIAEIKNIDIEIARDTLFKNAKDLFKI